MGSGEWSVVGGFPIFHVRRLTPHLLRRQEKLPRVLPEMSQHGTGNHAPGRVRHLARAQGNVECQREADGEVEEADGGDAEYGPEQQAEVGREVGADDGQPDEGRGERDVADIDRQAEEVVRNQANEETRLPDSIDYNRVGGLSNEIRQKLIRHRPETLGQAFKKLDNSFLYH